MSDDPKEVGLVEAILGDRRWVVKDKATDTVRSIEVPRDTQKPGKWMTHLKGLHNLKLLRLPNSTADDDVALLVALKTLENLDVSGSNISDAGLKQIGNLVALRELNLSACPHISSAGMQHLVQLKNLEGLDLGYTPVADDGLRHLSGLPNLGGLNLNGTKVTDGGLAHLAGLVKLQVLGLDETETTDAGLVHLHGLTKLRVFSGGTGVTRDGLKELNRYAPRIYVPEPAGGR